MQISETEIIIFRKALTKLETKVDEIHKELVGGTFSTDGGVIGRMKNMETEVEKLAKSDIKQNVILNIISFVSGAITIAIITIIFKS